MKKFIILFTLLLASSAFANPHYYGHGYGHRHHGGGGHKWVAPLIGGVLLGAIISDARANQQISQPPIIIHNPLPVYQPNTFSCLVQVYDPITRIVKNEVMICVNQ